VVTREAVGETVGIPGAVQHRGASRGTGTGGPPGHSVPIPVRVHRPGPGHAAGVATARERAMREGTATPAIVTQIIATNLARPRELIATLANVHVRANGSVQSSTVHQQHLATPTRDLPPTSSASFPSDGVDELTTVVPHGGGVGPTMAGGGAPLELTAGATISMEGVFTASVNLPRPVGTLDQAATQEDNLMWAIGMHSVGLKIVMRKMLSVLGMGL